MALQADMGGSGHFHPAEPQKPLAALQRTELRGCAMARGRPFQPGGDDRRNVGGRPKEIGHVRDLARAHTEDAIRTLVEIKGDKSQPAPARVAAATALLDRAWGKPTTNIGTEEGKGVQLFIHTGIIRPDDERTG